MSEADMERILKETDVHKTGIIHYHEFIAATFPVEKYATTERLESLFQKFNADEKQAIDGTTLHDAFTKLGHDLTKEEVEEVMNEHDVNHDHVITFAEFKKMILDHL